MTHLVNTVHVSEGFWIARYLANLWEEPAVRSQKHTGELQPLARSELLATCYSNSIVLAPAKIQLRGVNYFRYLYLQQCGARR